MVKRHPKKQKRSSVQLSPTEHGRVRQMLCARMVCSSAWAEHVIAAIDRGEVDLFVTNDGVLKADFSKVEKMLRRAGVYPLGGLLTLMLKCPTCGRWTPATGHEKGLDDQCWDCWANDQPDHVTEQWPSSPFGAVMAALRASGARVREGRI